MLELCIWTVRGKRYLLAFRDSRSAAQDPHRMSEGDCFHDGRKPAPNLLKTVKEQIDQLAFECRRSDFLTARILHIAKGMLAGYPKQRPSAPVVLATVENAIADAEEDLRTYDGPRRPIKSEATLMFQGSSRDRGEAEPHDAIASEHDPLPRQWEASTDINSQQSGYAQGRERRIYSSPQTTQILEADLVPMRSAVSYPATGHRHTNSTVPDTVDTPWLAHRNLRDSVQRSQSTQKQRHPTFHSDHGAMEIGAGGYRPHGLGGPSRYSTATTFVPPQTPGGDYIANPTYSLALIGEHSKGLGFQDYSGQTRQITASPTKSAPQDTATQSAMAPTALEHQANIALPSTPGTPKHHDNAASTSSTPTSHPTSTPPSQLPISSPPMQLGTPQTPLPELPRLTLAEFYEWMTNHQSKIKRFFHPKGLQHGHYMDMLKQRDHVRIEGCQVESANGSKVFLIDDADSMRLYWKHLTQLFKALVYITSMCDPDGVELMFTNSATKRTTKKWEELVRLVSDVKYSSATDIKLRLGTCLSNYQGRLQDRGYAAVTQVRPLSIYVFTDGIWANGDDAKSLIKNMVDTMRRLRASRTQVGIQFIRFGNNVMGKARLEALDKLFSDNECVHTHGCWADIIADCDTAVT